MIIILSSLTFILAWLLVYGLHIRYFRKHLTSNQRVSFYDAQNRRKRGIVISVITNMMEGGRKDVDVWIDDKGERVHRKLWEVFP